MIDMRMSLEVLKACIQMVRDEFTSKAALGAMHLIPNDLAVLTQESMWQASDRVHVQRVMTALRDGLAVAQGFAPFKVPAEYQAALIAGFVHSCNQRAACAWLAEVSVPASEIAAGPTVGSSEPVSAEQMFSLLMLARIDDPGFAAVLASKVRKQQQKTEGVVPQ